MKQFALFVVGLVCWSACALADKLPSPPIMIVGPSGRPLAGATVTITDDQGAAVDTWKNIAGTILWDETLPFTGLLQFFGDPGTYIVSVTKAGFTRQFYVDLPASTGAIVDGDFSGASGLLYKSGVGTYRAILLKLNGTAAPGVGDDSDDGYEVGSIWADVTADKAYMCLDATVGAAVWTEITQGGISNLNGLAGSTQTFAVDAGATLGWTSASTTHTLNLPNATLTQRGLVSTTTQEIAGNKSFSDEVRVLGSTYLNNALAGKTRLYGSTSTVLGMFDADTDTIGLASSATTAQVNVGKYPSLADSSTIMKIVGVSGRVLDLSRTQPGSGATDGIIYVATIASETRPAILIHNEGTSNIPLRVENSGGTLLFGVNYAGQTIFTPGVAGAPSFATYGDPDTGLNVDSGGNLTLDVDGVAYVSVLNAGAGISLNTEVVASGVSSDGTGKVVCVKADQSLGTCSDQPNGSGVCTCG